MDKEPTNDNSNESKQEQIQTNTTTPLETQTESGNEANTTTDSTPEQPSQINPDDLKPNSNLKKYIFTALVALIVIAIALVATMMLNTKDLQKNTAIIQKYGIPVLRIGVNEPPLNNLYPNSGTTEAESFMNNNILDTLVTYENRNQIVPSLATSWTNDDQLTWRFTLKPDVKMHNGKILSSEMVKQSLEHPSEYAASTYTPNIDSVVATDTQVIIKTKEPDATLLNKLFFLPIYDYETYTETGDVVGSGPFMFDNSVEQNESAVTLVSFADYHKGKSYIDKFEIKVIDSTEAMVAAYRNNEIDAGVVGTSFTELDKIPSETVQKLDNKTHAVLHIVLNSIKEGPLQKKSVREAIRYAIDAPAIVELRDLNAQPISQLSPELIPGHNPNIPIIKRDLEKAKQLLSDSLLEGGVELEMFYYAPGKPLAELIKTQLAEAGITINLVETDDVSELGSIAFGGKTDMFSLTWSSDILDSSDTYAQQYLNTNNYQNEEMLNLLNEANSTFNQAERLEKLQQVAQIAFDDVATVPIYVTGSVFVIAKPEYRLLVDLPTRVGVRWESAYSVIESN